MGLIEETLEDFRKKIDALETYEHSRQRKNDQLEAALANQAEKISELQTQNQSLLAEAGRLREYVHRLVSHIKMTEAALASFDARKIARRLHEKNNSWLIPDGLEKHIYEEAVEKVGELVKEAVSLPPIP